MAARRRRRRKARRVSKKRSRKVSKKRAPRASKTGKKVRRRKKMSDEAKREFVQRMKLSRIHKKMAPIDKTAAFESDFLY